MSEGLIIRQCSPTLAGMKTGSMFSCAFSSESALRGAVRHWNRLLSGKGLCMVPLRYMNRHALIYVYRPARLSKDLQDCETCRILSEFGYKPGPAGKTLAQLIRRFADSAEFPHEVGLFLSYPPEDVRGFIENHAAGSKCTGTWKVYGDADAARKTFQRYRKCTEVYCREYSRGATIEKLAVAG